MRSPDLIVVGWCRVVRGEAKRRKTYGPKAATGTIRCIIDAPGASITKLTPPLKRPRGRKFSAVRGYFLVLSVRVRTLFSRFRGGRLSNLPSIVNTDFGRMKGRN